MCVMNAGVYFLVVRNTYYRTQQQNTPLPLPHKSHMTTTSLRSICVLSGYIVSLQAYCATPYLDMRPYCPAVT